MDSDRNAGETAVVLKLQDTRYIYQETIQPEMHSSVSITLSKLNKEEVVNRLPLDPVAPRSTPSPPARSSPTSERLAFNVSDSESAL